MHKLLTSPNTEPMISVWQQVSPNGIIFINSYNHHNNYSDFKIAPIVVDVTANVTITIKIIKVNNTQTVLRAFMSVFTALPHILGGRNVFLSHSNSGVSLVFFKPSGKTRVCGLGGTSCDKTTWKQDISSQIYNIGSRLQIICLTVNEVFLLLDKCCCTNTL